MGIKVGIDLGTTFSAVAMINEKTGQPVIIPNTSGERITPSVIQFTEDGEIIVGDEAKEAYEFGEYGCTSVFKRNMGKNIIHCSYYGKDYTPVDLSAILLRYLKEEAEAVTHQKIDEAVVTVPAYFYHKERGDTMEAARRAGLNIRQIINEPTAAALNYGANHWRENAKILVYDLGGGTFDVTLVEMQKNNHLRTLQTTGDHTLGGKDWDLRLASLIQNRIESETGYTVEEYPEIRQLVMQSAESVKKQLTTANNANVRLNLPDYGRYTTTVSLEDFNNATKDLIEKTGNLCKNLLDGKALGWSDITDILLVGGSTRMRQVSSYLKSISGHTPLAQVNPDEAVALGAAVQAHLPLPGYISNPVEDDIPQDNPMGFRFKKKPVKPSGLAVGKETSLPTALSVDLTDVVAHAMGVIAVNKEGTAYINKTIVPANSQIPVKCAESFSFRTSAKSDNEMEIYVLQGSKAPLDCEIIGKYVVTGITHNREDNPTTIRIMYSYDVNAIIHVQARQGNSNEDLPIREEPVPEDMSMYGRPIDPDMLKSTAEDLTVMMAVDVSGSMSGQPLLDAKAAMKHFVDELEDYPGDVRIGAIAVSDRSLIVQKPTDDMRRVKNAIDSITECMTGICNDAHPFDDIRQTLAYTEGRSLGIVLADGMWSHQDLAVSAAQACHRQDIEIVGIGFGSADKEFLRRISNGDIESMLVSQSELSSSFGKIAQEIGGGAKSSGGRTGESKATATWLAINENM
jgi:molecular chaperone DnaK